MTKTVPIPAGRDLRVAVPLLQELLPDVEELFRQLPPLNVTRMFANTGDMAEAALGFVRAVFTAEGVDPRLREILTLRTAWILSVPYEWEANVPMARNVGVTDADIASIATDGPVTGLDATANLICRAADEITKDVAVSDITLQQMLDVLGPTLTTKYILEISWFNLLSRFLASTRVPIDQGSPTSDRSSPV